MNGEVYKIDSISIHDIELHDMANEHPLHDEASRNALKYDLEINGQNDPVLIYKGKIVDGRHRYWILKELGADTILVKSLPDSYTIEDVRERVFSSEIRRHQTHAQRAIQAFFYHLSSEDTNLKDAALKFGIDKRMVGYANYIYKHKGILVLENLYHNKKVVVGDKVAITLQSLKRLIEDELEAERKANCIRLPMADNEVKAAAAPYLDALKGEHIDVIEYVAKNAYYLAQDK